MPDVSNEFRVAGGEIRRLFTTCPRWLQGCENPAHQQRPAVIGEVSSAKHEIEIAGMEPRRFEYPGLIRASPSELVAGKALGKFQQKNLGCNRRDRESTLHPD